MIEQTKSGRAIYLAEYRITHRKEKAAYDAARRPLRKAQMAICNANYRIAHRPEIAAYYAAHKIEIVAKKAAYYASLKLDVLNAYGGPICICCGETLLDGLSIDHINGDGAEDRRQRKDTSGGSSLYPWLKKNGYPPGYQVLCMTCNYAKGTSDYCPHKHLAAEDTTRRTQ